MAAMWAVLGLARIGCCFCLNRSNRDMNVTRFWCTRRASLSLYTRRHGPMNNQLLLSCVMFLHISISAFLFGAAPITQIGYCFSCLGVVQIGSLAQYEPL